MIKLQEPAAGVALLSLNAPPLNLLTKEMKLALKETVDSLAVDERFRAVVLTGEGGRNFSAGADVKEFPERIASGNARKVAEFGGQLARALLSLPQITIAAIEGACLGGGCEVAICCDFRVATVASRLGFPEVKRGVFPGNGGTQVLPRLIGRQAAKRLILTGDVLNAEIASELGLVDRLVPDGAAVEAAVAWAADLAALPAQALCRAKRLLDRDLMEALDKGLSAEAILFEEVFRTADVREGVEAFFAKRPPRFSHR